MNRKPVKNYQPDFISGEEPLHTVPEAAARLGLARSTVWKLIRDDRIGYVLKVGLDRKIYHIPESALSTFESVRQARADVRHAENVNDDCVKRFRRLREQLGEIETRRKRRRRKTRAAS